jgi:methionyl-tRNA formyltransferase
MNINASSYVFAGNRFHVLNEMIKLNLNIKQIFAVKDSYLESELKTQQIPYSVILSKKDLVRQLSSLNFEFFISNGLPYKLPITELSNGVKQFINIHPSYLPDLRGADPVPGSILYQRDSGATCHCMNDEFDKGDIIERVKISYSKSWTAATLYQLSFKAEREVFLKAFEKRFENSIVQIETDDLIYYSFKPSDLEINLEESPDMILARIKAFNNKTKGAFFVYDNEIYKVFDAEIISDVKINEIESFIALNDRLIVIAAEDSLIVFLQNQLVQFKQIKGDLSKFKSGNYLS